MTHELKIQKQWADAKLAGEKPFEIRRNDRGFQKGDIVKYTVVDPKTGLEWRDEADELHPLEGCDFLITYVREGADGLEKGYCVYADQPVARGKSSASDALEKKFLLNMAKCIANGSPVCLSAFEHAMNGSTFTCYDLDADGFHCKKGHGHCCHQEKRPVSADLGSGATPSNGTAEPLAPPPPLADAPDKDGHTEKDSVAYPAEGCKDFVGDFNGRCRFAHTDPERFGLRCRCKPCEHYGKECPYEKIV